MPIVTIVNLCFIASILLQFNSYSITIIIVYMLYILLYMFYTVIGITSQLINYSNKYMNRFLGRSHYGNEESMELRILIAHFFAIFFGCIRMKRNSILRFCSAFLFSWTNISFPGPVILCSWTIQIVFFLNCFFFSWNS